MTRTDVVVVGAGPAGCMLAGELAAAGASVTVLEKHDAMSPLSRAFGVHARTLEVLDSRGLADELLATGSRASGLRLWQGASLQLDVLDSRYPFLLSTPQTNVDSLLERRAVSAGADVVRGVTVTGVDQDEDGVHVHGVTSAGERRTWEASYVVGADGVRSVIRDAIGEEFHGRALLRSIVLADVRLTDPPHGVINVDAGRDCFAFVAPFDAGWYRVIAWDRRDDSADGDPVDESALRDTVRRALGTDFGWSEVRWTSRFRCDERQVAQYRRGRAFLIGDAAHVHSPAGGQGMNTGIQDAANLGWKLAAVVGGADDAVLDTYQEERHPVGALVLRTSGGTIRMLLVKNPIARAVRNRVVGRLLGTPRIAKKIAGMFSGVGISYGRRRGSHPLVGTRAPDVPLTDGRLYEAMRGCGFVLVLSADADDPGAAPVTVTRRTDAGPTLLVRPDGYIAWAGASLQWRSVLTGWTGTATEIETVRERVDAEHPAGTPSR